MKKYWQIFVTSWENIYVYRLNFVAWRLRVVFRLLTLYFFWQAIYGDRDFLFGYSKEQMLTYILLSAIVSSFTISGANLHAAEEINKGDLSFYLVKPVSYLKHWFFRDLADKGANLIHSITELLIIYYFLKPVLFIRSDIFTISIFGGVIGLSLLLNYYISFIFNFLAFWIPETWGPRFIFSILMEFFAGGMLPLNILPTAVTNILFLTPLPYLLYFPLGIFLKTITGMEIFKGIMIMSVWIIIIYFFLNKLWRKGLREYSL
mgnify:CR=1 FL=1